MRTILALGLLVSCSSSPSELERYVSTEFRPDAPGGVVLVARGSRPVLHVAHGLADVEAGRPMSVDQPLPIGSLTKSFTAAALLALAAEGELSLTDDVREHVPEAPVGGHVVTLEQLLTHTSGIPSLVDVPGFFEWAGEPRTTEALLDRTSGVPFTSEPGASFSYSDTGYILLGAVLERMGGGSWDEEIARLVTRPLGLATVRSAAELEAGAAAKGYRVDGDAFWPAESIDWSVPHASGSLVATARELHRWVRAWRGDALGPGELLAPAWRGRDLPDGTFSGYGYGWKRCEFEGRPAIQHGGWVPGFTASVLHLPEEDLTAVCLSNADGGIEASYVARRTLRLLLTGSPHVATVELTDDERARVTGRYRTDTGTTWSVDDGEGEELKLDLGWGPIELVALSPTEFAAAESDGTWCFTFREGEGGEADTLWMSLTCEPQGRARRVD